MTRHVSIELLPLGRTLLVLPGACLREILFEAGVEFPCGGRGRCRGCRVRVLAGDLPMTDDDRRLLDEAELAAGWRLACRAEARNDLKLELAQWEARILADDRPFEFTPAPGLGIAIDLGTTTIVGQLVDQSTGNVLAVESALNTQARHGADLMSRVEFGSARGGGETLTALIRGQLEQLIEKLLETQPCRGGELHQVVLVGNTVMHHLFCGFSVEALGHTPFESRSVGLQILRPGEVGWPLSEEVTLRFLPCLGGFVGSDILAGILATGLHEAERLTALLDLGTNGEIVVGNRDGLLCASTAAGPAFEGARISRGMRAASGAISAVRLVGDTIECQVLGQTDPRGICGSGLVDAAACGLDLGRIQPNGRLQGGADWKLVPSVALTQTDIRELQLAKGAIAAGLRLLATQLGASLEDLDRVHLSGAFGNYINRASARRIGLLQAPLDRIVPAGNTALLGAKLALLAPPDTDFTYAALQQRIRHVCLHEDPAFQETYVDEMGFPVRAPDRCHHAMP